MASNIAIGGSLVDMPYWSGGTVPNMYDMNHGMAWAGTDDQLRQYMWEQQGAIWDPKRAVYANIGKQGGGNTGSYKDQVLSDQNFDLANKAATLRAYGSSIDQWARSDPQQAAKWQAEGLWDPVTGIKKPEDFWGPNGAVTANNTNSGGTNGTGTTGTTLNPFESAIVPNNTPQVTANTYNPTQVGVQQTAAPATLTATQIGGVTNTNAAYNPAQNQVTAGQATATQAAGPNVPTAAQAAAPTVGQAATAAAPSVGPAAQAQFTGMQNVGPVAAPSIGSAAQASAPGAAAQSQFTGVGPYQAAQAPTIGPAAQAGVTNAQAASLGQAQQAQTSGVDPNSVGNVSSQSVLDYNLQNYMNPYTQSVRDQTLKDLERSRQMQLMQSADQAIAAKAFGGDRQAVVDSLTNERYLDQAASTMANLNSQAYGQGMGLIQGDISNSMAAQLANQNARLGIGTTNAQLGTSVNLANAQMGNQQSQVGAGFQQSANLANAGAANQAAISNAAQSNQLAGLQGQLAANVGIANAGNAMQQNVAGAQMANQASQFNAGQTNQQAALGAQVGMYNAGQANQMAGLQGQLTNAANIASNQTAAGQAIAGAQMANQASQFNAGQTNQLAGLGAQLDASNTQFNAGQQNQMSALGANLSASNAQFNAGQTNQMGALGAQLGTQTNLANAGYQNAASNLNAQLGTQAGISNAANYLTGRSQDLSTGLAYDQLGQNAQQFNAGAQNNMAQFGANLGTSVNLANTAAQNAGAQFNANAQNQAGQYNANAQNYASSQNAQNYIQSRGQDITQINNIANWMQSATQQDINYAIQSGQLDLASLQTAAQIMGMSGQADWTSLNNAAQITGNPTQVTVSGPGSNWFNNMVGGGMAGWSMFGGG